MASGQIQIMKKCSFSQGITGCAPMTNDLGKCEWCGKPFEMDPRGVKRFCCRECQQKAYKKSGVRRALDRIAQQRRRALTYRRRETSLEYARSQRPAINMNALQRMSPEKFAQAVKNIILGKDIYNSIRDNLNKSGSEEDNE